MRKGETPLKAPFRSWRWARGVKGRQRSQEKGDYPNGPRKTIKAWTTQMIWELIGTIVKRGHLPKVMC